MKSPLKLAGRPFRKKKTMLESVEREKADASILPLQVAMLG
jgi:hypothetical protein